MPKLTFLTDNAHGDAASQLMDQLKTQYPEHFNNAKVLELGSGNVNGSVRPHFVDCEFIGIDTMGLPNVDILIKAQDTKFEPDYFDTLISFSMFEHDPDWKESILHNLFWLKHNGLILFVFGDENNRPHKPDPWIPIHQNNFIKFIEQQPIYVLDYFSEGDRYFDDISLGVRYFVGRRV